MADATGSEANLGDGPAKPKWHYCAACPIDAANVMQERTACNTLVCMLPPGELATSRRSAVDCAFCLGALHAAEALAKATHGGGAGGTSCETVQLVARGGITASGAGGAGGFKCLTSSCHCTVDTPGKLCGGCEPTPLEQKAAKTRYDLNPVEALRGMAEALTFGAAKHGAEQWRQIPVAERRRIYYAALMRHVEADRAAPGSVDEESGLPHLSHALACLAILSASP